jgi:hypothetical protein
MWAAMYMAATWEMLKVLSGLFLGKIPNALQANHPGIAVELGASGGMMWGVRLQARVKRSSGELPQQCVIQAMEIRSRLQ